MHACKATAHCCVGHEATCVLYEMLPSGEGGPWLSPLEQVGVVAALPQLHHNVEQTRPANQRPS